MTSKQDDDCSPEGLERRKQWFDRYTKQLDESSLLRGPGAGPYRCPCCRYKTLEERGGFEICPVCFWEDDGQDGRDADVVRGGPNDSLSLTQARKNYWQFGAIEQRFADRVRPPKADEQ
jgi:hypothetical protein